MEGEARRCWTRIRKRKVYEIAYYVVSSVKLVGYTQSIRVLVPEWCLHIDVKLTGANSLLPLMVESAGRVTFLKETCSYVYVA